MEQQIILLNGPSSSGKSTLAKALALLETGSGVIIDHVITSERIFDQLTEHLSSYPIRSVHIACPPDILKSRELARETDVSDRRKHRQSICSQRKDMTWSLIPAQSLRQRMPC